MHCALTAPRKAACIVEYNGRQTRYGLSDAGRRHRPELMHASVFGRRWANRERVSPPAKSSLTRCDDKLLLYFDDRMKTLMDRPLPDSYCPHEE